MEDSLKEYANELRSIITKSNDAFEKQFNYISAGSLGLFMSIIDKLVNLKLASCKWMLISSWILLGGALISNLCSHIFTSNVHSKSLDEIMGDNYQYDKTVTRNRNINRWNIVSISLMLSGILLQLIFIAKNI